jgi:hypothetical protein
MCEQIIVDRNRLINLQTSISDICNEFKEGNKINIRELDNCVRNVVNSWIKLQPNSSINDRNKISMNGSKLIVLQKSISSLADYFEAGRLIDINTAFRLVNNVIRDWIDLKNQ